MGNTPFQYEDRFGRLREVPVNEERFDQHEARVEAAASARRIGRMEALLRALRALYSAGERYEARAVLRAQYPDLFLRVRAKGNVAAFRAALAALEDAACGCRVVTVRPLTPNEMAAEGWEGDRPPVGIVTDDGTIYYPSRDPEGNGPGSLFSQRAGVTSIIFA